jgi:hypothetical protein
MNQMMPIFKKEAEGLASLGRYGDSYMVHAAEGETVIPGEILDANPGLKQQLFHQMQMMGIENPNRYVVGSALNSLNPITGQPEFFWKKLWKATKRSLPAIGAILGNRLMPGAAGQGIGAGIGSLAGGKSLKKSALIGGTTYGTSALAKAFMNDKAKTGLTGGQAFKDGLKFNPKEALKKGSFGEYFSDKPATETGIDSMRDLPEFVSRGGYDLSDRVPYAPQTNLTEAQVAGREKTPILSLQDPFSEKSGKIFADSLAVDAAGIESMRDLPEFVSRGGYDLGVRSPQDFQPQANVTQAQIDARAPAIQAYDPTRTKLDQGISSLTKTFDPFGGGIIAPAAAAGFAEAAFQKQDETSPEDVAEARKIGDPQYSSYVDSASLPQGSNEYYQARRDAGIYSNLTAEQLAASTGITIAEAQAYLTRKYGPRMAANGGEIVGPGTGTSDSIDAKLSDGEFVMTANAVRNAGNGDRDLGAARMYDMMSRFERGMA